VIAANNIDKYLFARKGTASVSATIAPGVATP
jgi:hypothetical protein